MEISKHLVNTNGVGKEIHEFIDQYWNDFERDHRCIFHHRKGIDYLINKFGEDSRPIILQHLRDDEYGGPFRGIPIDHNDSEFKPRNLIKFKEAKLIAENLYG